MIQTAMDPAEIHKLREQAEAAQLSQPQPVQTKNSRGAFRRQVMRELVTPAKRDQQQHEGKRLPQGGVNVQTDTLAETVFTRLGEAIRKVCQADYDPDGQTELFFVYEEIQARAAESGKMTWCKACGEEIPGDCRCSVKYPRVG